MKNNKDKILMIVGIMTLLLFVVGATFAYFVAQGGNGAQTNMSVTTHTTDSLVFEVGKAINITADQTTFAPGAGNRSDDTFARATLKANSSTNSATEHYYVYLNIDTNEFKYTTDTKTAELILTVNYKDTNGNITPVTSINGLNYVTVGEVSGFDITEEQNLITIANNYEITSTGTTIDEWDITLTLVNLDANQNDNTGKTFNATLLIQNNAVASQYIASLFTTQGANHLYHHNGTIIDEDGNILDAEDGSYRYSGGDYRVADAYKSTYDAISKIIKVEVDPDTTENPNGYNRFYLAYESPKKYYTSMKSVLEKAISDGYIVEDSVDNYVCFGTDNNTCDNDHLYRIIGVYDSNVKLIKADYVTEDSLGTNGDFNVSFNDKESMTSVIGYESVDDVLYKGNNTKWSYYFWNKANYDRTYSETSKYHLWSYSELNKTNLNTNYLNNIGTKWSNMIEESTWYVGGMTYNHGVKSNAKTAYNYELGANKNTINPYEPYKSKIGLMYLSEYYYGASSENWILPGEDANCFDDSCIMIAGTDYGLTVNDNWIFLGDDEWTISPNLDNVKEIFSILHSGIIELSFSQVNQIKEVRPTFYLKSTVTFAGGTGTETDPYRIA